MEGTEQKTFKIKSNKKKKEVAAKKDLWGGLCQSEGGGVVQKYTSGIHICGWGRSKSWKYNRKWTALKKRDGGSKDNDSYMSRVMCLISFRN